MKKVVIIGGGVSGLFSAYYLNKLNYDVTIIDEHNFDYGCSHGNAGLVVPSHIIPLASPSIIPKAIKWMFNSKSPLSFYPRLNKDFISWCFKFLKHANNKHVNDSIIPLRDISFLSSCLYKEVAEELGNSFGLTDKGLLMLYKNEKTAKEEIELAKLSNKFEIETKILSKSEIQNLDPNCKYDVIGGVLYLSDSHFTPNNLISSLVENLKSKNVNLVPNEVIRKIKFSSKHIRSVSSSKNTYEADLFLFSSGVWTSELLKKMKINMPLMPGKGYSFNIDQKNNFPTYPSILVDERVAVTPMNGFLRIGGNMEIDTINHKVRTSRVESMIESFKKYYPELNIETPIEENIWHGLRPCSPDGLPYIGNSNKYSNLFIATGHAMLGMSLGPATGKLISEIISDQKTSVNVEAYNPERYN
ncbi:MAG: FAD-dependent oxidoreductase [Ignavibacteriae bacterium]|nr:FAD-dependent oxidoreductase [Ignavibacteriota bacterium]